MNNTDNRFDYIERANRGIFENSRVLDAASSEADGYYTRLPLAELYRAEKPFGIPVYRDEESLLGVPYCHSLFVGATGSGKTVYIIGQILLYLSMPEKLRPNLVITDTKGELSDFLLELCRKGGYRDITLDCKNPFGGDTYNILIPMRRERRKATQCRNLLFELRKLRPGSGPQRTIRSFEKRTKAFAFPDISDKLHGFRTAGEAVNYLEITALLAEAECDRMLNRLVATLITVDDPKDSQWVCGARNLVKGISSGILELNSRSEELVGDDAVTLSNIAAFLTKRDSHGDFEDVCNILRCTKDQAANDGAAYLSMSARITRDGYVAEAQTPMSRWTGPAIESLISDRRHIDLEGLAKAAAEENSRPFVLFMKPDEDNEVTGTFINIFTSDAVKELKHAADASALRRLDRPTVFILDEFANLGNPIADMDKYITTMRSRNVFFELFIQSYEQLDESYGEKAARIIRQNCDLQVFLGTNSFQTREEVARSYGFSAKVSVSESVSQNGTNVNRVAQNTANVHASDLECMKLGELYVQASRLPHLHSFVKPYFTLENNPVAEYYSKKPVITDYTRKVFAPVRFDLFAFTERAKKYYNDHSFCGDDDDIDCMESYADSFLPEGDPRRKITKIELADDDGNDGEYSTEYKSHGSIGDFWEKYIRDCRAKDAETEDGTDGETDTGIGSDAETETEADAETDTNNGSETGTDGETDTGTGSDTDNGT